MNENIVFHKKKFTRDIHMYYNKLLKPYIDIVAPFDYLLLINDG